MPMLVCTQEVSYVDLDLPTEFDDLQGLLQTDLRSIVTLLAQRAHSRMRLTKREQAQLREDLWNRLAESINQTMAPLTIENR